MTQTQRIPVHAAEEEWVLEGHTDLLLDLTATPEELDVLAADLLAEAGYTGGTAPVFVFDVPEGHDLSGWAGDDAIHLDPALVSWPLVLHELAHFIDPRDGHEDRFTAHHVNLVAAKYGTQVARHLMECYAAHGAQVAEDYVDFLFDE